MCDKDDEDLILLLKTFDRSATRLAMRIREALTDFAFMQEAAKDIERSVKDECSECGSSCLRKYHLPEGIVDFVLKDYDPLRKALNDFYNTIGVGCLESPFATIRRLEFQSQNWRDKT